jgi:uncharacterized Zn ribbon protein
MRNSKSNVAITNNTADKVETEVFLIECSTDDMDITTAAPESEDSHSQFLESEDFSILENQGNNYSEGDSVHLVQALPKNLACLTTTKFDETKEKSMTMMTP